MSRSNSNGKWVLILVAFDDPEIQPQVLAERIDAEEDEHLAALMRGGELLDVLGGDEDESVVENYRRQVERECLR